MAQLAAMATAPCLLGLGAVDGVTPAALTTQSVACELAVDDDLSGLMTVLIALFRRFGVLLKLNARLTAMRVLDARRAARRRVPVPRSLVSMSNCLASMHAR